MNTYSQDEHECVVSKQPANIDIPTAVCINSVVVCVCMYSNPLIGKQASQQSFVLKATKLSNPSHNAKAAEPMGLKPPKKLSRSQPFYQ